MKCLNHIVIDCFLKPVCGAHLAKAVPEITISPIAHFEPYPRVTCFTYIVHKTTLSFFPLVAILDEATGALPVMGALKMTDVLTPQKTPP